MRIHKRLISRYAASAMIAFVLTLSAFAVPADAKVSGPNGRIAFSRYSPALKATVVYTVNPDGSGLDRLSPGNFGAADAPHWSPDGHSVAYLSQAGQPCCTIAAVIANVDTGTFRLLAMPATMFAVCVIWSPDASRLACDNIGLNDPSLNGIYTIRSSDGGGLTRLSSNPFGEDTPCDYSPDGTNLAFVRANPDGSSELNTLNLSTGVVQQLAPGDTTLLDFQCGSWSASGDQILFSARPAPRHRRALYVVNSDGAGLHQVPISPSCGGAGSDPTSRGCQDPAWSPDGTKIVFHIFAPGIGLNNPIFTANADGSGLLQITQPGASHNGDGNSVPADGDSVPDWGSHPMTG